ncbi:hypothetical protein [Nocardioides sp. Root140]|uniref:hypothetical protein n=1 Tax=Nocardioides sp. Root140 TaxID=1736460 RepID=UPI000A40E78F|nr:hypothetical protein [Nocardioides sp. Root140]
MATTRRQTAARQADNGRYKNVSEREARAAARAKVTIDERRGKSTQQWVKDLAEGKKTA